MPQICDMGQTALLPFRRKARWGFFFALKIPTASSGFEPANLGTKGQHATSRPPKPLRACLSPTLWGHMWDWRCRSAHSEPWSYKDLVISITFLSLYVRKNNSWQTFRRNLYGSHPVVFISNQTALIQSNTTQVYFDSKCASLHVSACT